MIETITLTGGLPRDAEHRYTPNGVEVANFTLAQSDNRKNQNGEWETSRALYLDVTAWNDNPEYKTNPVAWATIAAELRKGDQVTVRGKLITRSWENNGTKHTKIELLASAVYPTPTISQQPNNRQDTTSEFGASMTQAQTNTQNELGATPWPNTNEPPF